MSMFSQTGSIFTALAAEEDATLISPETQEEAAADAGAAVEEVEEASADVSGDVEEVTNVIEGGEELVDVGEVAQEAVEGGEGMDETAAKMTEIAVESILNKIKLNRKPVPSAESFGASHSRLAQTKLTVEGIADTLRQIWQAIKRFAARVWDKLVQFFAKLFNSTGAMGKHLQALGARARAVPADHAPLEKKLKNAALAKKIAAGSKAGLDSFKTIAENAAKLSSVADGVTRSFADVAAAAQGAVQGAEITEAGVASYLKSKKTAAEAAERSVGILVLASDSELPADHKQSKVKDKNGVKTATKAYGPFVGSVFLRVDSESRKFGNEDINTISLSFVPGAKKGPEEVDALTAGEVGSLVGELLKMNDKLADFKKTQEEGKKVVEATNKLTDKILGSVAASLEKTGGKAETSRALSEVRRDVSEALSTLNNFANRAPGIYFATISAGADYASASLRNLGAKK